MNFPQKQIKKNKIYKIVTKKKKKRNRKKFQLLQLERIKKIEGKIKLMMKTLLYRTEPC